MDPEDTISVVPSAENGLLPVETEPTPSEPTEPVAPTVEPTEPVTPPTEPTEPELFELPDGRKVDASTLTKEWKENFYPEYTRKSQELAAVKSGTAPITTEPAKNSLEGWVPQSYDEIVQKTLEVAEAREAEKRAEEQASQRAIEEAVTVQLTEIKTKDPTVNENALFQHALKYNFRDLRHAHQNMKDMADIIKKTQTTTVANVQKRTDPVSGTPGATGARPDPSQFQNAREYLRSLK